MSKVQEILLLAKVRHARARYARALRTVTHVSQRLLEVREETIQFLRTLVDRYGLENQQVAGQLSKSPFTTEIERIQAEVHELKQRIEVTDKGFRSVMTPVPRGHPEVDMVEWAKNAREGEMFARQVATLDEEMRKQAQTRLDLLRAIHELEVDVLNGLMDSFASQPTRRRH